MAISSLRVYTHILRILDGRLTAAAAAAPIMHERAASPIPDVTCAPEKDSLAELSWQLHLDGEGNDAAIRVGDETIEVEIIFTTSCNLQIADRQAAAHLPFGLLQARFWR